MPRQNCSFEFLYRQNDAQSQLPWNQILFETDNFVALPTLGGAG